MSFFGTPLTVAHQAPLSMGFSRQKYWSELPFHSPGDLPNPRIKLGVSCIAGRLFTIWATMEASALEWQEIRFWPRGLYILFGNLQRYIFERILFPLMLFMHTINTLLTRATEVSTVKNLFIRVTMWSGLTPLFPCEKSVVCWCQF